MKQQFVNEIYRMRKEGIRTLQDKKNLWAVYHNFFGRYPDGSMDCPNCVTNSFWEAFEHVNAYH